jgi:hypothetical protein
MRVPQVSERVKEAPAQALRAVFAGIGQVLLVADRMRNRQETKPAGPASDPVPAEKAPAADVPAAQPTAPAQPTEPSQSAEPAQPAASAAAPPATGALPLANYDELTVASLRARMRVLDQAQLRALIDYENSHAARPDVVSMFERRIAKLETGG